MLFSDHTYVGVDLSPGKKNIQYAAMDDQLELLALAQGDLSQLQTFLHSLQNVTLAIHGPSGPNQRILTDAQRRDQYLIPLGKGRPGNMRVAEYTLRQQGLPTYRTPAQDEVAPAWMQTSFKFFSQLKESGFQLYKQEQPLQRKFVEVIPETSFHDWLKGKILPANTLHGRMQRQIALYDLGLKIADPMAYFEEITRFRILQGILPKDMVYSAPAQTALAAAYMAWLVEKKPNAITLVGIPEEGQIAVLSELIKKTD